MCCATSSRRPSAPSAAASQSCCAPARAKSSVTADTPVPYRMADLLALIDERIGRLEGRSEKPFLRSLKMRLIAGDQRPALSLHVLHRTRSATRSWRPSRRSSASRATAGRSAPSSWPAFPPKSSIPSPRSSAAWPSKWRSGARAPSTCSSSARRRTATCPPIPALGFFPTRQAIARIAKEGRKYGVSLGIITQRPGELDQTILSQCSTHLRHAARQRARPGDHPLGHPGLLRLDDRVSSPRSAMARRSPSARRSAVPMRMRFSRVDEELPARRPTAPTAKVSEDDPDTVDLRKHRDAHARRDRRSRYFRRSSKAIHAAIPSGPMRPKMTMVTTSTSRQRPSIRTVPMAAP